MLKLFGEKISHKHIHWHFFQFLVSDLSRAFDAFLWSFYKGPFHPYIYFWSHSYFWWGETFPKITHSGDNESWPTWARWWLFSGASLQKDPPSPCWARRKPEFLQAQTQGMKWFLLSVLEERQDPERRQRRNRAPRRERTSFSVSIWDGVWLDWKVIWG